MMLNKKEKISKTQAPALLAALALPLLLPAPARAGEKVYLPYVEQGETELEWQGSYEFNGSGSEDNGAWKQKLGIGYGVNDFWMPELEIELEKEAGDGENPEIAEIEWENLFQFTPAGEHWLDVGALLSYARNLKSGPDKAEARLLLAKDTGKFSHSANIGLEQEISSGTVDEAETSFAWNTRYRYKPAFEPGFEIFSDFGALGENHTWNEQGHRIGPTIRGKLGPVKYDTGLLFGISDSAPDGVFKLLVEYEF